MLTLLLVAALLILVVFWIWLVCPYKWSSFKNASTINKIPGPKPLPFIGNSLHFNVPSNEVTNLLKSDFEKYGPIFRIWHFGNPYVFTTDAANAELLLKSRTEITKSDSYDFLHGLMGLTLGTSSGELWHSQRKMLDPAFHSDNLRDYISVFNENSEILVDNLTSLVDRDWVDIQKWVALCSLDILCETVMGVKLGSQHGRNVDFVTAIHRICEIIIHRILSPWLFRPLAFKLSSVGREEAKVLDVIHKFAGKVIKEKREAEFTASNLAGYFSDTQKKRPNLLEILIKYSDEKGVLSDKDIGEEVATFLFVGHDTSTVAICWALFLLGLNPEIQDRVVAELEEIFGDSGRQPDISDLNEMKYMERMIKEALRLYPGVPIVARKLEEDMQVDGYTIPAGTNLNVISYFMHRDPKHFPDPEKFDPDRFLPENMDGRHPYCYVPFSAGPRNCIGQRFALLEEKVMLSFILRKFRITSLDKREDITSNMELVLRASPGLRMKFTPRS